MRRISRYWQTTRHLKPVQIAGRLWFHTYSPRPDRGPAPKARATSVRLVDPVPHRRSLIGPNTLRLLGARVQLDDARGWDDEALSMLVRYNLHYFDDLTAPQSHEREGWHRDLTLRWVRENPPGKGTGWSPYPTSLRIVNWTKWALLRGALAADLHQSLAEQVRWLRRRMEYHLLGNHLFANAKALMFAGTYFDGEEASQWFEQGRRIVEQELAAQILADGGHFERSPMYHATMLEDLLDLINVIRARGETEPTKWREICLAMQQWLEEMSHPDGAVSFFNDAALDIAPTHADLAAYAARLSLPARQREPRPLVHFAESGYARARMWPCDLIVDCAPIGPDHLPAHAHADTLSFELSLHGRRVLVNSGTSEYGTGPERHRQRGTAAHNTVVVDGEDSSEVWGGFRVARRARASMSAGFEAGAIWIQGSHDGYRRLRGHCKHERTWRLDVGGLTIHDCVIGDAERVEAFFHLHPEVQVANISDNRLDLVIPNVCDFSMHFEGARSISTASSTWHPRFGATVPNQRIAVRFAAAEIKTRIRWASQP